MYAHEFPLLGSGSRTSWLPVSFSGTGRWIGSPSSSCRRPVVALSVGDLLRGAVDGVSSLRRRWPVGVAPISVFSRWHTALWRSSDERVLYVWCSLTLDRARLQQCLILAAHTAAHAVNLYWFHVTDDACKDQSLSKCEPCMHFWSRFRHSAVPGRLARGRAAAPWSA